LLAAPPKTGRSKGLVTPQGFARAPAPLAVQAKPVYSAHALNSQRMRESMVMRLRAQGIQHPRVLTAMAQAPRHAFVDAALASRAYEDTALPIGSGQTISQPYIVARMLELALLAPVTQATGRPAKWLEIGTGCGYQAAVMAQLAAEVISIERIKALSNLARNNLRPLRVANLRLIFGDGLAGHADNAPYEAIIVAAAGLDLPLALLQQLAIGGRAVVPLSNSAGAVMRPAHASAGSQWLTVIERVSAQQFTRRMLEPVNFVPLLAGTQ
jgi:protein-L-isoaspartate(D-aspartate) O-methyltransferase